MFGLNEHCVTLNLLSPSSRVTDGGNDQQINPEWKKSLDTENVLCVDRPQQLNPAVTSMNES